MKKKLLQTTSTKKLEKVYNFFNITKANKSKKNSFQPIRYPNARTTTGKP